MINIRLREGLHEYDIVVDNKRLNFLCDFKPESENLIIFLHGLACSRDTFQYIFEYRYFSEYSLLLPDLIGFGRSSKPDRFSYAMEDQASLCEQVMALFPTIETRVVAHSMGGAIGLLFSARLFERIKSFANIEGNLIGEDCGMLSRGIADVTLREYRERIFEKHKARFLNDPVLEFENTSPVAVHRSARSMVKWSDSGELLERFIRLPGKTCYFWGEKNSDMPILQRLSGMKTCMIRDSGHGMMVENPKEFYSKLAEFLMTEVSD
jgi:pimeloyl-ACP methyl ester carboxylesterase